MSDEKLKACPLCGGEADGYTDKGCRLVSCKHGASADESKRCNMAYNRLARGVWQSLPRVSGELAEIAEQLRNTFCVNEFKPRMAPGEWDLYYAEIDALAVRIESIATHAAVPPRGELAEIARKVRIVKDMTYPDTPMGQLARKCDLAAVAESIESIATHAEKPGACSHWIGGHVRGRCGRDARAEKPGEDGPGKLGPFGGHGEPPAEKPGEGCGVCALADDHMDQANVPKGKTSWRVARLIDSLGNVSQSPVGLEEIARVLELALGGMPSTRVSAMVHAIDKLRSIVTQPPSPIAAVVDLADRLDYVEVNLGHDTTKESREMLIAIAAQLRESAPEPVMGQAEAWVEFEDPDEIGVELLITDVHLAESDLHTERWVRVPVHGAPQTEQGDGPGVSWWEHIETVEAMERHADALRAQLDERQRDCDEDCESTMDELRDKLAGAYDSLREHMDMIRALRARVKEFETAYAEKWAECNGWQARAEIAEKRIAELEDGGKVLVAANTRHFDSATKAQKENSRLRRRIAKLELALDNQPGDVISFCTRHCAASDRVDHARCRAERYDIGKECCNGLVAWASDSPADDPYCVKQCGPMDHSPCRAERVDRGVECSRGYLAAHTDSPAETDEGPEYETPEYETLDDAALHIPVAETDEGPCETCNILPQDRAECRRLARNGDWAGCPPYLRWLRKHGATVLPPHPKPNKA